MPPNLVKKTKVWRSLLLTLIEDLTSPSPTRRDVPAISHTPPTPSKAPQPKRHQVSSGFTTRPLSTVNNKQPEHLNKDQELKNTHATILTPQPDQYLVPAQVPEPAARKIEINENYDDDEDEDTIGNV